MSQTGPSAPSGWRTERRAARAAREATARRRWPLAPRLGFQRVARDGAGQRRDAHRGGFAGIARARQARAAGRGRLNRARAARAGGARVPVVQRRRLLPERAGVRHDRARAGARAANDARRTAVRGLLAHARGSARRARPLCRLAAGVGALVARDRAHARQLRPHAALPAGARAVRLAALHARASGLADPRRRRRPGRRLPHRARLARAAARLADDRQLLRRTAELPAHLLERRGHGRGDRAHPRPAPERRSCRAPERARALGGRFPGDRRDAAAHVLTRRDGRRDHRPARLLRARARHARCPARC